MLKLTPGAYPFPIKHNLLYVWGTSACCVLINSDIWLLYLVKRSLWNRSCIYQPRFSFCVPRRMTCVWLWCQQWKLSVHLFTSGCICVLICICEENLRLPDGLGHLCISIHVLSQDHKSSSLPLINMNVIF